MCGFTNKTMRFCAMMTERGYEVYLYGGMKNTAPCKEFVPMVSEYEQSWVLEFKHYIYPSWNPKHAVWVLFNERAAREIRKRGEPGDWVCVLGGSIFEKMAGLLPDFRVVEYGIGYHGWRLKRKIWESAAWKFMMSRIQKENPVLDTDPVIHSFWDENTFPLGKSEGYLLYVGRLTEEKGVPQACQAAQRTGRKLLVIGHGNKKLVTHGAAYLGEVTMAERDKLIAGADALLCPTQKFEAFGNIVPEAGFCGTRVLAGVNGAFHETVIAGVTGWCCPGVDGLVDGISKLPLLGDRETIRKSAIERFSFTSQGPKYDAYFHSAE
jgi:glycosyltransferase involved in cell wall biosynthesis